VIESLAGGDVDMTDFIHTLGSVLRAEPVPTKGQQR
jgi:hypothetical protein